MERSNLFNPKSKQFWLLAALFLLGVTLMLMGSRGGAATDADNKQQLTPEQNKIVDGKSVHDLDFNSVMTGEEKRLAQELCLMLKKVAGAGQVEVSVRLASSTYHNYAINATTGLKTTEEKDQGGGIRQVVENTDAKNIVLSRNQQGVEGPLLERETAPQVAGVLVVAQGATKAQVKADLYQAIQVALGVPPHKVVVLPMEGGRATDENYPH